MPESFGARLRQQREERGIDLVTIAQQTKIKTALLEALERDDVSQWPSGLYRRAFFRAYARAIHLDPDAGVRQFLEAHPEPPEVDVLTAMASALERGDRGGGPTAALRGAVGSALESLSRRRRSPSVDDRVVTNGALNHLPPPVAREPEPVVAEPVVAVCATPAPVEELSPAGPPPLPEPDPVDVARLCTEIGRVENATDVQPLLQEAATLLGATGLIVWLWDASAAQLKPVFVYGYSDKVVAQLPSVGRDDNNATAAAFRMAETRAIPDSDRAQGALVVPLMTPSGCAGVLAIELQRRREQTRSLIAFATILAAQLAHLVAGVEQYSDRRPGRLVVGGVPLTV